MIEVWVLEILAKLISNLELRQIAAHRPLNLSVVRRVSQFEPKRSIF